MVTAMMRRFFSPFWVILTGLFLLVAAGAVALWRGPQSIPDLDVICALARKHEFDEAEKLLSRYLRALPEDQRGHLLMAQFAMDRPDPKPELALDHLRRIQPRSPQEAAIVQFSEGKAHYQQKRYDLAEQSWNEALKLDPAVPEAGWALLDLLDFEGRQEEAHRLGMRLYEHEPDPRDQARLLLEMTRIDIDKIAPGSQVQVFEPVWREHPDNLPLGAALGLAFIHDSQADQGLEVLRTVLDHHPGSAIAWDSWLTGLDDGFRPDQLREEFQRLPQSLRADPRFAKHEGTVAQGRREWPRAIAAYRRAVAFEPYNGVVLYRLRMALRHWARTPISARWTRR